MILYLNNFFIFKISLSLYIFFIFYRLHFYDILITKQVYLLTCLLAYLHTCCNFWYTKNNNKSPSLHLSVEVLNLFFSYGTNRKKKKKRNGNTRFFKSYIRLLEVIMKIASFFFFRFGEYVFIFYIIYFLLR